MHTLRLALTDAAELQTESVDSHCADCELSAQWCDQHQAEQEQRHTMNPQALAWNHRARKARIWWREMAASAEAEAWHARHHGK